MIKKALCNRRGMSLVELAVTVAIVGIVVTGFGSLAYSLFHNSQESNAQAVAANTIEDAGRLIAEDGQMAQTTDLVSGAAPVASLTLSWVDPVTGDSYLTVYSLSGSDLMRTETINSGTPAVRIVARNVGYAGFSLLEDQTRVFQVTLTSSGGNARVQVTREYYVTLRAVG